MTSVSVAILREKSAQEAISEEWDAAVPVDFAATLKQSAWYFAWRENFPAKESIIVTARESGRLVGVLPVSRVHTDARGLYLPQITTFTGADYQAPVVATNASSVTLPLMVDAAIEHFGRRYVYWWANIPVSDSSATILATHLRSRGMRISEEYRRAPRIDLSGRTYAEIESSWSSKHRTDVRRQKKRLAAAGEISIWEPTELRAAEVLLEEFFSVHDEKWLSQGQPGRFQDIQQRRHFSAIVKRLWGRGLHFSALRCGNVNVSFFLGFFSDGWIQCYRPTYRRDYQNCSPGKVHVALLVEKICQLGWNGIDFLQGTEEYKLQWSNQEMRTVDYYSTFRPWSLAFQWFTRGKPYVRNQVGPLYWRTKARLQKAFPVRKNRETP